MSLEPPKLSAAAPTVKATSGDDWRDVLVKTATEAGSRLSTRERSKNPMIPDNFMDLSGSGLPSDIQVLSIPIPRHTSPSDMAQYQDMIQRQWLHLPWSVISKTGGQDGKAVIPGAAAHDLGNGQFVVTLAGNFLMFANRKQYEDRRKEHLKRYQDSVQYKLESRFDEDKDRLGDRGGKRVDVTNTGPMTVDEMFEYEKRIGEEAPITGARLD